MLFERDSEVEDLIVISLNVRPQSREKTWTSTPGGNVSAFWPVLRNYRQESDLVKQGDAYVQRNMSRV